MEVLRNSMFTFSKVSFFVRNSRLSVISKIFQFFFLAISPLVAPILHVRFINVEIIVSLLFVAKLQQQIAAEKKSKSKLTYNLNYILTYIFIIITDVKKKLKKQINFEKKNVNFQRHHVDVFTWPFIVI